MIRFRYRVGRAKTDVTTFVYNKGMMGYALHSHVVKDIETPLYCRALVIEDKKSKKTIAYVNTEICFYTIALKDAVIKKLKKEYSEFNFGHENVILSAQHTHSGPGGYSHHILYNLAIPGFQKKVFNDIVNGTVEAIITAAKDKEDANLFFTKGEFGKDADVAFNRSLNAYNSNPEVKKKILKKDHHLAIDREMKLLRFNGKKNKPLACINWFGVHTTSVNNDHYSLCSDNKGYAAQYLENEIKEKENSDDNFLGIFAQDTAGDVSPNYQFKRVGSSKGKFKNDYKSAQYNGKLQKEQAEKLFEQANNEEALSGGIDFIHQFINFSNIEVDSEFVMGMRGKRTAPSAVGTNVLRGANDRPALPPIGNFFTGIGSSLASSFVTNYERRLKKLFMNQKNRDYIDLKYKIHGKKGIALETDQGKIFGTYFVKNFVVPAFTDPVIDTLKKIDSLGYSKRTPWMPRILPIQIVTIGELALICLPVEITTIAGKRIKKTVKRSLKHKGIKHVILSAYSNGYSGYITTHEEYETQNYEGAHTIFGKWTLAAYQTKLKELSIALLNKPEDRKIDQSLQADIFKDEEIWYGEGCE